MAVPDLPDLIRVLKLTGQYFTFDGRWANVLVAFQTLRMFFIAAGSLANILALFFGGLRSSMGIEMCLVCLGVMTTIKHIYLWVHRKTTEETIRTFQEIRNTFQKGSEEEFKSNTRAIWMVIKVYSVMFVGTCAAMSLPFLTDLVVWAVWKTEKPFRIPIAMDSFIGKESIRDAKYFVVTITSGVWMMIGGTAELGIVIFLAVSCCSYSSMVQTFCNSLRLHPEFTSEQTTAHLKRLAAHQQALFKLSLNIRKLFGLPFCVQSLHGALCICSLLFVISSDGSNNPLLLIPYIALLLIVLLFLGGTAYVGQHVKNKTSDVFETLYEMNWYELRPSDRRYLVTMLSASREPFRIHFCGLLPLDMQNFLMILNTSYSYLMFLKSMM